MMFNKSPAVTAIQDIKSSTDIMKDFIDLVNNPEKIQAAHEKVRAEHTLTEEQAIKYQSSLEFSEKYEGLANVYNQHVEELEAAKKAHAKNVDKHSEKVRLDLSLIDERQEDLEAGERQLKTDQQKLEDERKEQERLFSELRTPIDDDISKNIRDKEDNEKEAERLKLLALKLAGKSSRLKKTLEEDED